MQTNVRRRTSHRHDLDAALETRASDRGASTMLVDSPTQATQRDLAPAVMVQDLVKTYARPDGGPVNAVDGMNFVVEQGEIFAILGPNGAGKTTTLEILEGIKRATAGEAWVLGHRVGADQDWIRRHVGVQLQAASYFEHLRLGEILELFGSFYETATPPIELLEIVGLADRRNALVRELSGGQAQRFSIVAALVNDPDLVFLDEPTTGLDPQARRNLWEVIEDLNRARGKTVVLTTHYMEEAELLAHRVGIVDAGRMVVVDTSAALIARFADGHRIEFTVDTPFDQSELERLPCVEAVSTNGAGDARYRLTTSQPDQTVPALYVWAGRRGVEPLGLAVQSATLEDVFLAVTGRKLRD